MKTITRKITGAASADAALLSPPPRTRVTPLPIVPDALPAANIWQSSMSSASESTLRHLIFSPDGDNFYEGSEGPPFP